MADSGTSEEIWPGLVRKAFVRHKMGGGGAEGPLLCIR